MKKIIAWLLITFSLVLIPATSYGASPWTEKETYGDKALSKLVFGARNLLFGWTEIFVEPGEAIDNGENIPLGIGKGLLYTVVDTVGGALHMITAPFMFDIPLPDNGIKF